MQNLQPLIEESAQLMLIGMGTVFIILVMLIFLINGVSKLLKAFNFVDQPETHRTTYAKIQKQAGSTDKELVAVISGAVSKYRKSHSIN